MNNIFDIKRFGKYFLYDLRNAKNNFGLSLLICGTLPVTLFIIYELISLIFTQNLEEMGMEMKWMQLFVAITIIVILAGVKIYGSLTEKRAGSNFLMLPASTFEKWLSMGLILCIVVPFVLLVLQIASDALMSFLFPNTYGDRVCAFLPLQELTDTLNEQGLQINIPAALFLNWCESVLIFTLGAVCFKKGKVGKTILCLIGLSFVLSTLLVLIVGNGGSFYFNPFEDFDSPAAAARTINWVASIVYIVVIGGLLGALYYRLRTLKH
jgi:hypothetical protein